MLAEQDSIPSDCSVLVIAGPQSDFFQKELDMVDSYLEKGGKLLLMLDPGAANGFVKFLTFWGLDVGNDIVVDASGVGQLFGAGPTIPIVSQYEDHVLTKDFNVMTFYPEARSISKAEYAPKGVTATELAKTSPRSWGETSSLTSGKIAFDEGKDLQGPVNILAVVEKDAAKAAKKEDKYNLGTSTTKARLIVFGDSDFASNSYFSVQGNGNMFMNSISWLAENEDLIAIRPRDPEDRRLNLTKKQSKMILYFGVILLPLVVFVIGIVVYRKRK